MPDLRAQLGALGITLPLHLSHCEEGTVIDDEGRVLLEVPGPLPRATQIAALILGCIKQAVEEDPTHD